MAVHLDIGSYGGGIFSIYSIVVDQLLEYPDFITCTVSDKYDVINHAMVSIMVNNPKRIEADCGLTHRLNITNIKEKNFTEAKKIVRKFTINQDIQKILINFIVENKITSNTLGVHIRLTDMNIIHDYSKITIEDYIKQIKAVLQEYPTIDTLFIASDNNESLRILEGVPEFKPLKIVYHREFVRAETQDENTCQMQIQNLSDSNQKQAFINEAFVEMLTLSKCGYLIHRTSNIANFAILYSDLEQKIYSL